MSLNFIEDGDPIAYIIGGKRNGEILYLARDKQPEEGFNQINIKSSYLYPIVNPNRREVYYVAGPSGSGKSTYVRKLAETYQQIFPDGNIYIFCRTNVEDDPAYRDLGAQQVDISDLHVNPVDIEHDIEKGSFVIFDDTSTINDKKIKESVIKLQIDIMEVGRKLGLYIAITNHLVNPNERSLGRIIMNEMTSFTFFPRSGFYQASYCLKNYFGMRKKDIDAIMLLPTRWVTLIKNYPMVLMYQHGAYQI